MALSCPVKGFKEYIRIDRAHFEYLVGKLRVSLIEKGTVMCEFSNNSVSFIFAACFFDFVFCRYAVATPHYFVFVIQFYYFYTFPRL